MNNNTDTENNVLMYRNVHEIEISTCFLLIYCEFKQLISEMAFTSMF